VFPGHFGGLVDADLCDNCLGGVQMYVAHTAKFAIFAILSQAKFAKIAIAFFAMVAIMRR
jgi:hypothetical protein